MTHLSIARIEQLPAADAWHPEAVDRPPVVLGQSEWLAIPGLGLPAIEAKLDTGARTSVLHAENIAIHEGDGGAHVRFDCHPLIDDHAFTVRCEAPLWDVRDVRSSNGEVERRPFILQRVENGILAWDIEINLTCRRAMRHRMLLGRAAIAGRFLVDPSRQHLLGSLDPAALYPPSHPPAPDA